MEGLSRDERSMAQSVEIVLALLLGVIVTGAPILSLWLADLGGGPDWATHRRSTFTVSVLFGAGVTLLWLLRARRVGL